MDLAIPSKGRESGEGLKGCKREVGMSWDFWIPFFSPVAHAIPKTSVAVIISLA